jgi:hypothetical protein
MRSLPVVASAIVVLALFSISRGDAQSLSGELRGGIVFAPNATRTVTFSRGGVAVASFEVPSGKWLRVSYDDSRPGNILPPHLLNGRAGGKSSDGRVRILDHTAQLELHGDVSVRVDIAQNMVEGAPKMPVEPAPVLSLAAQDVDVLITGRHDQQ